MDRKILTIVVEVIDQKAAEPIWDAMKGDGATFLGCAPYCLAWGDLNAERDKYQSVANQAMKNHPYDTDRDLPETVETECGKTFYQWPFEVYSTSEKYYDSGEWFAELDELKKTYKVVKEDGREVVRT